jgi:hypothetical protein
MGCKNNNFSSRVMNYIETKQTFLGFFCVIALGVTMYLRPFAREGIIFHFYEYLWPFAREGFIFQFYRYLQPFAQEDFVFGSTDAFGSCSRGLRLCSTTIFGISLERVLPFVLQMPSAFCSRGLLLLLAPRSSAMQCNLMQILQYEMNE